MTPTNSNAAEPAGEAAPEKRLSTLRAKAALHGIAVHQLADGGFIVCRWGMSKDVPDLDALARFLFTMGVR